MSGRSRLIMALGVTAAAVVVGGYFGASRHTSAAGSLPGLDAARSVYNGDLGDPFVLPVAGRGYVLYGTDDPPDHIPTATSPDLVHWTRGPDAVPVLPQWAGPDPRDDHVWAPTAVRTGARFLLYITVPDRSSGAQCIAVLQSASPVGPFVDARGSPLVCQSSLGGSIDPSVFTSGGLHLVWKSGSACCGPVSTVWQQRLTPDGLSVTGQAHEILHADRPWQGGIIENPAILKARHGGWWLFYSGNQFDRSAYATGVAHCATLDGPCRETSDRPLLSGSDTLFSPGGLDVFRSSDGRVWAAYAVWNRPSRFGRFFCCRSVLIAPFRST